MNKEAYIIGLVVLALSNILSLGILAKKFMGAPEKREITPQPLQVEQIKEFATRQEVKDLEMRMHVEIKELRENDVRGSEKLDKVIELVFKIAGKMGIV